MKTVTSDQSCLLSVFVCYLFRLTHQSSHTRGGQSKPNVVSCLCFLRGVMSDGREDRSSSPDIKLAYPFVPSQMMPDNINKPHGAV